eukprot:SAG31_NODE_80_length_27188_cov_42.623869_8_plen_165_part_00
MARLGEEEQHGQRASIWCSLALDPFIHTSDLEIRRALLLSRQGACRRASQRDIVGHWQRSSMILYLRPVRSRSVVQCWFWSQVHRYLTGGGGADSSTNVSINFFLASANSTSVMTPCHRAHQGMHPITSTKHGSQVDLFRQKRVCRTSSSRLFNSLTCSTIEFA